MTGSGACHKECLCYFPSREEINFLWFFRNDARGRRLRRFKAQGDRREKEAGWWCDECLSVLMRPLQRGPLSKKLDEDGLKRVGDGRRCSVGGRSLTPNCLCEVQNVLCCRLMLLLEGDEELPWACFELIPRRNNFSTTKSIFDGHSQTLG